MAERTCETCGAKNDVDARFCATCDAYLGWDVGRSTLGGDALTGTIPRVVGSVMTEATEATEAGGAGAPPAASGANPSPDAFTVSPSGDVTEPAATIPHERHDPPTVTVATPEATVTPDAAAEVGLAIENTSNIVDGYVIEVVDPPTWLDLQHPDTHLMPGEGRTVTMSLAMRPGIMVLAQRLALTLVVRSMEDAERSADVRVLVTVPPLGPRLALEASPTLIRLEDTGSGSFSLRLDNRGANYPQTVELSGGDPEGLVRFAFSPQVVEAPAGSMVEAAVTFAAPRADPGQTLNRQLTITATNDEGPITALVTLVQHTAPAPVDAPIRVQVQPSTLRLVDAHDADFEVRIDNRGGHSGITVSLSGHDPEERLAFAFAPARFVAVPGRITLAHGRVRTNLPPRGTSAKHPFTVVASDGTTDVEDAGVLEVSTSATAITTAQLHVEPQNLNLGTHRDGAYGVDVDNRRGTEPLHVAFAARSDDGQVRVTFAPAVLDVGAGGIGHARMSVSSPHPQPEQVVVRKLEVTATDGAQSLTADAQLMQTGPDRRRPASRWLVILGAILVVLGALSPWFAEEEPQLGFVEWIVSPPFPASIDQGRDVGEEPLRFLVLVLAVAMAFGMAGKAGGLTRKSAFLIVLLTVGSLVFIAITSFLPELSIGLPIIWVGAVIGYIGGVLARPRK